MRKADRVTAALLLALAVAFSAAALRLYPYSSEGGPGSGFLPFWLGLLMAALALMLLLRRAPGSDAEFPGGEGRTRLLFVLGLTVAFVALLKVLGMIIGTAIYLALIIRIVGRHPWWVAIAVALGAAGFNYLLFARWLRVPLPEGMLWIS